MAVNSRRIYTWAMETIVTGPVTSEAIRDAAAQYMATGMGQVWLLDATGATDFDIGSLPELREQATHMQHAGGLDRVALVLPAAAQLYKSFIQSALESESLNVTMFDTADAAYAWIASSCR